MKKRYIIGLILCCLMIIPLVGCSGKKDATTATKTVPKTPLQILTDRVNASDAINYTQDQTDIALSNRITTEIAAVSQVDLSPINARLGVLEALNFSDLAGGLSFLTVRVTSLESYNISGRLAAIEARLNTSVPAVTPTPNGSTPTPTPIPSGNHAPNISSLIATSLGSTNQSWIVTCTANDSDGDVLSYIWAKTGGEIFLMSGSSSVLWTFSTTGNYSIVVQASDGRDGYALGIKSVTY